MHTVLFPLTSAGHLNTSVSISTRALEVDDDDDDDVVGGGGGG